MLAPIEAAWMFLKSQPTERDARLHNEEEDEFPPMPPWSSTDQGYNPDKETPYPWEKDNQAITEEPTAAPPKSYPYPSWYEGPTIAELADMSPEEADVHIREAGRRSATPTPKSQTTLHDY